MPHLPNEILCIYGNWLFPSTQHKSSFTGLININFSFCANKKKKIVPNGNEEEGDIQRERKGRKAYDRVESGGNKTIKKIIRTEVV